MKTAFVTFKNPQSDFTAYSERLTRVSAAFAGAGLKIDSAYALSSADDIGFKRLIDELKDTADIVVIALGEKTDFDAKAMIAESFGTELAENDNAARFLDAARAADGVNYSAEYAVLPDGATIIPNEKGPFQGFTLEGEDFLTAVVSDEPEELYSMCARYVLPYAENKYGIKTKTYTFKIFGDDAKINEAIAAAEYVGKFGYALTEKDGDYKLDLVFRGEEEISDKPLVLRKFVELLGDDIYAEFDTTLSERLFDLIKLKGVRVAAAESFTGGRVTAELVKNSGISEFLQEGLVTYSNESKVERLGVRAEDIFTKGAVSSVVAYQMAAGLLKTGKCDLAIATTGIAGPKSDASDKPVGLCYIAIGTIDGVHTYKYELNGSRERITERAKNIALALAVKILKRK